MNIKTNILTLMGGFIKKKKILPIIKMPLLHIKLDYTKVQNGNQFRLEIPEEIPSQMLKLKSSTVILSGNALQYALETTGNTATIATSFKLPITNFNENVNSSRVFVRFKSSSIINSRQLLSTTDNEGIPIPMDYNVSRDKYQYNYIDEMIHFHGIPKVFDVEVYMENGNSAEFGKILNDTNKFELIDLVFEYANLD